MRIAKQQPVKAGWPLSLARSGLALRAEAFKESVFSFYHTDWLKTLVLPLSLDKQRKKGQIGRDAVNFGNKRSIT